MGATALKQCRPRVTARQTNSPPHTATGRWFAILRDSVASCPAYTICFSPHSPQNFASAAVFAPQLLQNRAVAAAAPQLMQNFAPAGMFALHLPHVVAPAMAAPPL